MTTAPVTPADQADQASLAATAPAGTRWASRLTRRRMSAWSLFLVMVIVAVIMLYPFWYIIDNAFRGPGQFDRQAGHSLAGWHELFANLPVAGQLLNSMLVCVAAIAIILLVSTTSGFPFPKL